MVGIAHDGGDRVPVCDEQRFEQERDLAVSAEDQDACHGFPFVVSCALAIRA